MAHSAQIPVTRKLAEPSTACRLECKLKAARWRVAKTRYEHWLKEAARGNNDHAEAIPVN